MKKLILSLSLMAFISLGSIAQQKGGERPTPEQRAAKMTEKMAEELGLTADQKKQILEIHLNQAKKMDKDRTVRMKENEARKAEMDAKKVEMKKHDDQIKAVLTEAQRVKWEENKLRKKDKDRGRSGQNGNHYGHRNRKGGGK